MQYDRTIRGLQSAARSLGIQGFSRLSKEELCKKVAKAEKDRDFHESMLAAYQAQAVAAPANKRRDMTEMKNNLVTPGEWKVLTLVAEGCSNAEVAAKLIMSPRTVQTHVCNMLWKLDLPNRTALARWALEHKPVPACNWTYANDSGRPRPGCDTGGQLDPRKFAFCPFCGRPITLLEPKLGCS